MGFDSVPPDMIDKTIIEEAQSGGSSNSSFQREYCAQFTEQQADKCIDVFFRRGS